MNPRTVLHLFTADARRLRWLLLAAALVLLLDLIPVILAGPWEFSGRTGFTGGDLPPDYTRSFMPRSAFFIIPGWIVATAAGWSGMEEARVRPVRRREIAAAKLLFLLLLWLPQSTALLLVYRVHGIAWPDAWVSLAACAAVFVPLWLVAFFVGRIAGSFWRSLVSIGLFLALWPFASLFRKQLLVSIEVFGDAWGANCGPLVWALLSSLAAGLAALHLVSRRWRSPARILSTAVLMLADCFAWRGLGWFKFSERSLRALTEEQLAGIMPQTSAPSFTATFGSRKPELLVLPGMSFSTAGLPPGVFCYWQCTGEAALLRNGQRFVGYSPGPSEQTPGVNVSWLFPSGGSPLDNASLAAAMPQGTRLRMRAPRWTPFVATQAAIPELKIPQATGLQPGESVSLEAAMTGALYRHEIIADLPLTGTRTLSLSDMRLGVRGLELPSRSLPGADIAVITPSTGWGSDALQLNWRLGPIMVWRVFLYLPKSDTMIEGDGDSLLVRSSPLLGGAAACRRVFAFNDDLNGRKYAADEAEGARLIIIAPRCLGIVHRTLRTAETPVELNTQEAGADDFLETLRPAHGFPRFFAWARTQRPDPTTATEEQFGQWLRIVMGPEDKNEWKTAELAAWVPRHLETLRRIPACQGWHSPWIQAIAQALPEGRKQEIMSRVPTDPAMVPILAARGWIEDARRELVQLYRSGRPLDSLTVSIIAGLDEPALRDSLLERLERNGETELLGRLLSIEEVRPRAMEAVRRFHARISIHGKEPAGIPSHGDELVFDRYSLAARAGIIGGLADQLAVYRWLSRDGGLRPYLCERLAEYVELPAGLKRSSREACEFFLTLKPEQCRWDELSGRWLTQSTHQPKP